MNFICFFPKTFFPKFELSNTGCALSASAAYPWLLMVIKSENKLNKITKTGTKNVTIIELQTEMHKTSGN